VAPAGRLLQFEDATGQADALPVFTRVSSGSQGMQRAGQPDGQENERKGVTHN